MDPGAADTFIPNWDGPVTITIVNDYRVRGLTPVLAGDLTPMRDGSPGMVLAFREMVYPGGRVVALVKAPREVVEITDAMTGSDRLAELRAADPRNYGRVYGGWLDAGGELR